MSDKPNLLISMLRLKCPRCREGSMFTYSNPYNLKHVYTMPVRCSVCGQPMEPENGFYWGAMFASYAITVGFSIAIFLIMYSIWGWVLWEYVIVDSVLLVAVFPVTARYARVLWIYININYKAPAEREEALKRYSAMK